MTNQITTLENLDVPPIAKVVFTYINSLVSANSQKAARDAFMMVIKIMQPDDFIVQPNDIYIFPWHELRRPQILAIRSRMLALGYKESTINQRMNFVKGIIKECWRQGLLTSEELQACLDFSQISYLVQPAGRQVEAWEIRALLEAVKKHNNPQMIARDSAIVASLYAIGARREEFVSLQLSDYNENTGVVMIYGGKGRKDREVKLQKNARAYLTTWLAVRSRKPGPIWNPWDSKLKGFDLKKHIHPTTLVKLFNQYAVEAGVEKFTPHDFRRSFITNQLDAGVDPVTITTMSGHSDPAMVKRYDRGAVRRAEQAIDTWELDI